MKYKHIIEQREYKYGPNEELKDLDAAKEYVYKVKNKVLTEFALNGYYNAINEFSQKETENSIVLTIDIKYPSQVF